MVNSLYEIQYHGTKFSDMTTKQLHWSTYMDNLATVEIPVDPKLEQSAEAILAEKGITVDEAITALYHYIVANHKLPFDIPK